MATTAPDMVPGTLDMLVLKTLASGPSHGYAIGRRIHQTSRGVLHIEQGSLYPALHRLARRGMVKSKWGTSSTKRRVRTYHLTAAGRKRLKQQTRSWSTFVTAVSRVMRAKA